MTEEELQAALEWLGLSQAHLTRLRELAEWDRREVSEELAWIIDQEYGARILEQGANT